MAATPGDRSPQRAGGSGAPGFEFDDEPISVAPAQSGQTRLTVNVQRPRRFGRPVDREFSVDATAERGPTRQAAGTVETRPIVPMALVLLSGLVLVLGLSALGFAVTGGDDGSQYSCKRFRCRRGASSRRRISTEMATRS
jgi:hypothetical protein